MLRKRKKKKEDASGIFVPGFLLVGIGLWKVIKNMERRAEPNLRTKINISKKYDEERFNRFLEKKVIITRESQLIGENMIEEFTWDEKDKKWFGNDVRIKLRADTNNLYILSAIINIDKPKNINSRQVSSIMEEYIKNENIIY